MVFSPRASIGHPDQITKQRAIKSENLNAEMMRFKIRLMGRGAWWCPILGSPFPKSAIFLSAIFLSAGIRQENGRQENGRQENGRQKMADRRIIAPANKPVVYFALFHIQITVCKKPYPWCPE
jgi:hypothetical protein